MEAWKVFLMFIPISCLIVFYYYSINIRKSLKPTSKKEYKVREFTKKELDEMNKYAASKKTNTDKENKDLADRKLDSHYKSLVKKKNEEGVWDIPGVPDKYLTSPRVDGILPLSKGTYNPNKFYQVIKRPKDGRREKKM